MSGDRNTSLLLPRFLRTMPADLVLVLAATALTLLAVLLPGINETPLRIVLGLPFVLFLPGYAFIAALFPEAGGDRAEGTGERASGIDGIERVALSFGLSIAIVPLLGLALNFTPWGIRLVPILVAVSGFTVLATVVAAVRRRELPPDERFSVPFRAWYAGMRTELFKPDTRTDLALNILLVLSILLAVGSVGYAVAVPKEGEKFTEFYILTEQDGELIADEYPTEYVEGEAKPVVIGIGNQEHERVQYTAVVAIQRVEVEDNETTVLEQRELTRFTPEVEHNETWTTTYDVAPTMTGTDLRLVFLLYDGGAPAQPTVDNAYRELHLWVNVTAPET